MPRPRLARRASRNTLRYSSARSFYALLSNRGATRKREGRADSTRGLRGAGRKRLNQSQLRERVCETVKTMHRWLRPRLPDCCLLLCYETAMCAGTGTCRQKGTSLDVPTLVRNFTLSELMRSNAKRCNDSEYCNLE